MVCSSKKPLIIYLHKKMKIILHWLIMSVAVFLSTQIISGIVMPHYYTAIIVGALLTLFYYVIKPVISLLTLPINLITLGFFSLVINGLVYWFIGSFVPGFHVETFMAAFWGALLVSVANWILSKLLMLD